MATRTLETSFRKPTFEQVSRNLDIETLEKIRTSRELPAEWKNSEHLQLAHRLHWEECDAIGYVPSGEGGTVDHHPV